MYRLLLLLCQLVYCEASWVVWAGAMTNSSFTLSILSPESVVYFQLAQSEQCLNSVTVDVATSNGLHQNFTMFDGVITNSSQSNHTNSSVHSHDIFTNHAYPIYYNTNNSQDVGEFWKIHFSNLAAGCRATFWSREYDATASYRTFSNNKPLNMVVTSSDQFSNSASAGAYAEMAKADLDVVLFLGELLWRANLYDTPSFNQAYRSIIGDSSRVALFRTTPVEFMWHRRDHNFNATAAWQSFQQIIPHHPLAQLSSAQAPGSIHRAFNINPHVRVVMMDTSFNVNVNQIMLSSQLQWVIDTELARMDQWDILLLCSADAISGENWQGAGASRQRDLILDAIQNAGNHSVIFVGGGDHMLAFDSGENHAGIPAVIAGPVAGLGSSTTARYSRKEYYLHTPQEHYIQMKHMPDTRTLQVSGVEVVREYCSTGDVEGTYNVFTEYIHLDELQSPAAGILSSPIMINSLEYVNIDDGHSVKSCSVSDFLLVVFIVSVILTVWAMLTYWVFSSCTNIRQALSCPCINKNRKNFWRILASIFLWFLFMLILCGVFGLFLLRSYINGKLESHPYKDFFSIYDHGLDVFQIILPVSMFVILAVQLARNCCGNPGQEYSPVN